MWLKNNEIVQL